MFGRTKTMIRNILIVEDEPLVAFDNELHVAAAGYQVVATVDNEVDAIAALAAHDVQLVLADVKLANGGRGTEVARIAHGKRIAVLFVTGSCPADAKQYAIGCLKKPYTAKELVAGIRAVDQMLSGEQSKALPAGLSLFESANSPSVGGREIGAKADY